MTRATIIWFVGAAVVGAAAGGLHLLRSELGGAHTGTSLAVAAFGLTALAAFMLYHGVVVAAREQDAAAGPVVEPAETAETAQPVESADGSRPASAAAYSLVDVPEPADVSEPVDGAEMLGEAEPPAYTFRGAKPVGDRTSRPARRDRSSRG